MGRSIWAIFCGVLVASLWIVSLEWINGRIYPWPQEISLDDPEAVARYLESSSAFLWGVSAADFVASFIGGWLAGRTARRKHVIHALLVGMILFAIGITKLMALPHPVWFWVVGQASFLVGGFLGGFVASLTAVRPTPGLT